MDLKGLKRKFGSSFKYKGIEVYELYLFVLFCFVSSFVLCCVRMSVVCDIYIGNGFFLASVFANLQFKRHLMQEVNEAQLLLRDLV